MVDIAQLSEAIVEKVSVMPKVNHDDKLMVGSRTRSVAFDADYIKSRYRVLLTSDRDIDTIADVIVNDCADRDYWYWYEKEFN